MNFWREGEALEGVLLPIVEEFIDTGNPCFFHCKLHKIIFKYSPHNITLFILPFNSFSSIISVRTPEHFQLSISCYILPVLASLLVQPSPSSIVQNCILAELYGGSSILQHSSLLVQGFLIYDSRFSFIYLSLHLKVVFLCVFLRGYK